ncbi:unnamed protein product [Lupinus luteus]|uniref:SHSP domain-containing protein n=1 Tax=Lupinus luteus TaxID=3873 RepID=A0AAV1WPP9_LUPLU
MSVNVPTIYEDLKVKYETKETREALLMIVHIPDGFAKEHIGAKVEFDERKIRVFGEQPLTNDRTIRFNIVCQVPPTCDINGIKGKFDGGIVTITIQKKLISKEVSNNQKPQQSPKQEAESNHANNKETIPKEKSTTSEVKDKKFQDGISGQDHKAIVQSKEEVDNNTTNPPKVEEKTMPQKGQKEENIEKERVVKEVPKEETKNTSESRKHPKNDVVERVVKEVTKEGSSATENEIEEERKEPSKVEESFVDPKFSKEEEKEKEKKRKGSFDDIEESYGKRIPESRFKRMKEVVASASEAVTSVTKKFNDEDKQKLIYMGAAVVMVALGVYASYKFRSSPRL